MEMDSTFQLHLAVWLDKPLRGYDSDPRLSWQELEGDVGLSLPEPPGDRARLW